MRLRFRDRKANAMRTIRKEGCGGEMKSFAKEAKRPPKVSKGVANDLHTQGPRSAIMPRPTKDTRYTRKG